MPSDGKIVIDMDWTGCGEDFAPQRHTLTVEELEKRDPDGTSLIAAKMRFVSTSEFTLSGVGPADDEYMSPALWSFAFEYIRSGSLVVPPELEADDAERCLEYLGFKDCVVEIADDDPARLGKQVAYKIYRDAMKKAPTIVKGVEKVLLSGRVGGGGLHLVVDDTKATGQS